MLGIFYGVIGLLFMPFFFVMAIAGVSASHGKAVGGALAALAFAVFFPFLYAAMGFVFGLLGALLYNLLAGWIGGIEVEVE